MDLPTMSTNGQHARAVPDRNSCSRATAVAGSPAMPIVAGTLLKKVGQATGRPKVVPDENDFSPPTAADLGLCRKDVHGARRVVDHMPIVAATDRPQSLSASEVS